MRAGSRLGFMREMRDASGEAARAWGEVGGVRWPSPAHLAPRSRGFATRVSHLAHKTQTRACSQATNVCGFSSAEKSVKSFLFQVFERHISNCQLRRFGFLNMCIRVQYQCSVFLCGILDRSFSSHVFERS